MGTELANLDAFKGQAPSTIFAKLDPSKESLADGIGSSYGVLGYRGKSWSLRHRGEKYNFLRPDDGTPITYIDVVILRDPGVKSKSYYAEGFDVGGSEGKRPTCASLNGVTPDADVVTKQADACALCPRNQWRTDANGKKSRECSDYKRLAVLVSPKQTLQALGTPLIEPVFLRIPPASLNDLAATGEAMEKQGFHYSTYMMRISFEQDKAHPQFVYRPLQKLSEAEGAVVMQLREDPLTMRITGDADIVDGQFTPLPAPGQQAAPAPAPTAAPVQQAPQPTVAAPPVSPTPAPVAVEAAQPAPAQPVQPATPVVIDLPAQGGGAFGLDDAAPPLAPVQPVRQTAADTAAPATASDSDLDAKLKALL